jgi:hypothetical protein
LEFHLRLPRLPPIMGAVSPYSMTARFSVTWIKPESKITPALGCSWIFVYPFQTGKTNYMITVTTFGAKAKEAFRLG